MQELMLELLTYEPFAKMEQAELDYINQILNQNYAQPVSVYSELYDGFHKYVKCEVDTFDWLVEWYEKYYAVKSYNTTSVNERLYYPVLFKRIGI